MKNQIKIALGIAVLMVVAVLPARAASDSVSHQVTIVTPSVVSLTADTANFTLTFSDFVNGSETDTKVVTYTVNANGMSQADDGAAMSAALNELYTDKNLQASVGNYTKTSGNTELAKINSGYVTINTNGVNIAKKTASTGSGKVLNGTLPVTYKAVATNDLEAGSETKTLTITLSDQ